MAWSEIRGSRIPLRATRTLLGRAQDVLIGLFAAARPAGPALAFGLRLWAAVCLTFYVAFWLELDTPYWAATTAAIVCQPSLGASLRKASFRIIGTVIGAIAIVVLTACFPQSRVGFLLGLALWGALCGLLASVLQNFASYAAALAGYTAVIIASDELGQTGGIHGSVLMLAINRGSEICIGIVCAGIVLAGTDFGHARRRLAAQFSDIAAAISNGFCRTFMVGAEELLELRLVRRGLIRAVAGLGPIIDEAIGESSELRYRSRALQAAVDGLFAAIGGWRAIAAHRERTADENPREFDRVASRIPLRICAAPAGAAVRSWAADPLGLRQACRAGARNLTTMRCASPTEQLAADHAARALLGLSSAFDGLALLMNPARAVSHGRLAHLRVPDWLPSIISGVRAFATIAAVELFWIITAWPNGALAIVFATIPVTLLAAKQEDAHAAAETFMLGAILAAVLAAIVGFAVLPLLDTFAGFSLALGVVLVPLGAIVAQPWAGQLFALATINFVPMLAPSNLMVYDTRQFYNSAAAIIIGALFAVVMLRLIPPLSPAERTRRLLALTLRDLRRLAANRRPPRQADWENRIFGRLSVLPQQAELQQAALMATALLAGSEVIRLWRAADQFGLQDATAAALDAFARGNSALAVTRLAGLDQALAAASGEPSAAELRLRARGAICAITEALTQYAPYFDTGATR